MIASPRLDRLAAVFIALYLTVPLCVGSSAQTQDRDRQQSSPPREPGDGAGIFTTSAPASFFETEPNGTAGTADSMATQLAATRYLLVAGAIDPGGDVDFYTFTAAAGSRIWLLADTGGPQTPASTGRDSVLDLLAADGTTVIETDDEDGTGNGGDGTIESGSASVIAGRTLTAGGYYIRHESSSSEHHRSLSALVVITTEAPTAEVGNNNNPSSRTRRSPWGFFGLRSGSTSDGDVDYYWSPPPRAAPSILRSTPIRS